MAAACMLVSACELGATNNHTDYAQMPASFSRIYCNNNGVELFRRAATEFSVAHSLVYRERIDRPDGTVFVIIMQSESQQIWISSEDGGVLVAQYLARDEPRDAHHRAMFDELARALSSCARQTGEG